MQVVAAEELFLRKVVLQNQVNYCIQGYVCQLLNSWLNSSKVTQVRISYGITIGAEFKERTNKKPLKTERIAQKWEEVITISSISSIKGKGHHL